MSKFLIVGAGQAGLQLALGLVQDGHDVTVVSNRTPDDIRNGRVMSSQCMFRAALEPELEGIARDNDLVVVAAGKGDVAQLFERDPARSPYSAPQRALALTYVTGMEPRPEFSAVCFNLIPTVGEYFVFPALTTSGACE